MSDIPASSSHATKAMEAAREIYWGSDWKEPYPLESQMSPKQILALNDMAAIIAAAKKAHACSEALAWARSCNSDEQFWAELKPEWACWLRCNVRGLSPEVKAQAEAKACEKPQWAYCLRRDVLGLSPEVKAQAEAKACESPKWAFRLRRDVLGLSPEAKARADAASAGRTP